MVRRRTKFEGFAGKPYNPDVEEQRELLEVLEKAAQLPDTISDWRVLYIWFAQGRRDYPEAEQAFVDIVIITHCAGLLASEFPRLAAAAAAVLAHFFGPEGVDGQAHFVVLQHYIPEVGDVLSNPAIIAELDARADLQDAGRLAVAAAAAAHESDGAAGRFKDVALMLLPGLRRAVAWSAEIPCARLQDCMWIAACAELLAEAAQLTPAAGSAAAAALDDPLLLGHGLQLADNSVGWLLAANSGHEGLPRLSEQHKENLAVMLAKSTSLALQGVHCLLQRGVPMDCVAADTMLSVCSQGFDVVRHLAKQAGLTMELAPLAEVLVPLFLSTGGLLQAALAVASDDTVKDLAEAAASILDCCDEDLQEADAHAVALVAARHLRLIAEARPSLVDGTAILERMQFDALPALQSAPQPGAQPRTCLPLPADWGATPSGRHGMRDEDLSVLLAQELAAAAAALTRDLLASQQSPLGSPDSTRISAASALISLGSVPLLASFLGTGDGAADCSNSRAWRTSHQGNLRLPGEPRGTKVLLAADRAVAAVLAEVGHVYIAAANLPDEQVQRFCAATGRDEDVLTGLLQECTEAAAALLVHLERELAACQRHGGGYVDAFWPPLQRVLAAVLCGGGPTCPDIVEGFVHDENGARVLPRVMLAAAAAGRSDVLIGLCGTLEQLVQRSQPAADRLLRPVAATPTWPEYMRQFQQKAKRQQLPGAEPALARVTAALDAAALKAGAAQREALQEIDTHNAQPGSSEKRRGAKSRAQVQKTAPAAVASDTAADQMARMLLQEEDELKQQQEAQAAKAARKKAKKQRQKERKDASSPAAAQPGQAPAAASTADADRASPHAQPGQTPLRGAAGAQPAASAAQQQAGGAAGAAGAADGGDDSWRLCPLTQAVMVDPVMLPGDGRTYERSAIANWIDKNGTSPLTGRPADVSSLTPNHTLRSLLQALA